MNYSKPEIAILGDATAVIESIQKDGKPGDPPVTGHTAPAYDLDE